MKKCNQYFFQKRPLFVFFNQKRYQIKFCKGDFLNSGMTSKIGIRFKENRKNHITLLKGTVMQIEKALLNDRLRVSKVS